MSLKTESSQAAMDQAVSDSSWANGNSTKAAAMLFGAFLFSVCFGLCLLCILSDLGITNHKHLSSVFNAISVTVIKQVQV